MKKISKLIFQGIILLVIVNAVGYCGICMLDNYIAKTTNRYIDKYEKQVRLDTTKAIVDEADRRQKELLERELKK